MNIPKVGTNYSANQVRFGIMDEETKAVLMGKELDELRACNAFTTKYTEKDYERNVRAIEYSGRYTLSLRPGTDTVDIYKAALDEDGEPLTRVLGKNGKEYVGYDIKEYVGELLSSTLPSMAEMAEYLNKSVASYADIYYRTVRGLAEKIKEEEEIE